MIRFARYGGVALAALLITTWALQLWNIWLDVPLVYGSGDSINSAAFFKGIIENPWFLHNPALGAPFGQDLYDFPSVDGIHVLLVRFIGLAFPTAGATINVFYIVSFPLAAVFALFVLRRLGVSTAIGMMAALLYAFAPFHFCRGLSHIFLAAYYLVPVICWLALRIWDGKPPFFGDGKRREWAVLGLACLAIGSTGFYYAFFGCFLFCVAALASFLQERNPKAIASAALLVMCVATGVVLNLLPSQIHWHQQGRNQDTAQRLSMESEHYGLKVTQMMMPVDGHRIPLAATVKAGYNKFPLMAENSAMLGLVAVIGLLSLILRRLCIQESGSPFRDRLSILCLACILLATVGGFGSMFAIVVSPMIRAYNRISIFISFFAICEIALLLDLGRAWLANRPRLAWTTHAIAPAVLIVGLLDQVSPIYAPDYDSSIKAFRNDEAFVKAIEAKVQDRAMIYQLPYVPFPENPQVNELRDYDLFKGYLHSHSLRWSYGAMRGRPADHWHHALAERLPADRLGPLAAHGFAGIYLDRRGYSDLGLEVESTLKNALGDPLISQDANLSYFSLADYSKALQARLSPQAWSDLRDFEVVYETWNEGCYGEEGIRPREWRWMIDRGMITIQNATPSKKRVEIAFTITTGTPHAAKLTLVGALNETLAIGPKPVRLIRTLEAPPGKTIIRFSSNTKPLHATGDSRVLHWKADSFTLKAKSDG